MTDTFIGVISSSIEYLILNLSKLQVRGNSWATWILGFKDCIYCELSRKTTLASQIYNLNAFVLIGYPNPCYNGFDFITHTSANVNNGASVQVTFDDRGRKVLVQVNTQFIAPGHRALALTMRLGYVRSISQVTFSTAGTTALSRNNG